MPVERQSGYDCWMYRVQIKGKRFSRSTKIPLDRPKSEAESAARLIHVELEQKLGLGIDPTKGVTFGDAAERWWSDVGHKNYSRRHVDFLKKVIGAGKAIDKIVNDDVAVQVAMRIEGGALRWGGKLAPAGIDLTTKMLRMIMRYAVRRLNAHVQPIDWHGYMQAKAASQSRVDRALTFAHEEKIEAVQREEFTPYVNFLILQGLRKTEAIKLEWDRVDFYERTIKWTAKRNKPREAPMAPGVYELLKGLVGQHPRFVFTYVCEKDMVAKRDPKHPNRRVVLRHKGQRYPFTKAWVARAHQAWVKAGVKRRIHDCRHTFATRTLKAGTDLHTVSGMLGHSGIGITSAFYLGAASLQDQREAMERTAAYVAMKKAGETQPTDKVAVLVPKVAVKRGSKG